MVDDLSQCVLLFVSVFSLVAVQLVQILNVLILLFELLLGFLVCFSGSCLQLPDFEHQGLDLLFESATFALEQLPY